MASFKDALEKGYGIELDVRRTKDGTVIVFHNSTLERTGTCPPGLSCNRLVKTLTDKEIAEVDVGAWKGSKFAGERIPTFAEVLALLAQYPKAHCLAELKAGYGMDFEDPELPAAAAAVVAASAIRKKQLTWISFSVPALQAVKGNSPFPVILVGETASEGEDGALQRGSSPEVAQTAIEYAEAAVRYGFDGIDLEADPDKVTPALGQWLKERGLLLAVWVHRAPADNDNERFWNAMAAAGVDYFTSNLPPSILDWPGQAKRTVRRQRRVAGADEPSRATEHQDGRYIKNHARFGNRK